MPFLRSRSSTSFCVYTPFEALSTTDLCFIAGTSICYFRLLPLTLLCSSKWQFMQSVTPSSLRVTVLCFSFVWCTFSLPPRLPHFWHVYLSRLSTDIRHRLYSRVLYLPIMSALHFDELFGYAHSLKRLLADFGYSDTNRLDGPGQLSVLRLAYPFVLVQHVDRLSDERSG